MTLPFVNGATGPIEVRGAKPGDMLTRRDPRHGARQLGFTALWPGIGMFPDWVRRKEFGIQTRVVEVKDGVVHWNDTLKLPVRPMIGVIGVAPVHGAVLTVDNGTHGGNLDVQEITTGNTVMFRVNADGRPSLPRRLPRDPGRRRGERHGRDRDRGNAHGARSRSRRRRRGSTIRASRRRRISARSAAPGRSRTPCGIAFEEMIYWLEDEWGIPAPEGYMLLGQIAEARCTQVVNPKYTYICKVNKSIIAKYFG